VWSGWSLKEFSTWRVAYESLVSRDPAMKKQRNGLIAKDVQRRLSMVVERSDIRTREGSVPYWENLSDELLLPEIGRYLSGTNQKDGLIELERRLESLTFVRPGIPAKPGQFNTIEEFVDMFEIEIAMDDSIGFGPTNARRLHNILFNYQRRQLFPYDCPRYLKVSRDDLEKVAKSCDGWLTLNLLSSVAGAVLRVVG
jgi:hypothetical protein